MGRRQDAGVRITVAGLRCGSGKAHTGLLIAGASCNVGNSGGKQTSSPVPAPAGGIARILGYLAWSLGAAEPIAKNAAWLLMEKR